MTDEEIIKCFNICLKCDTACEGCGFKGEVCDGSLKGKIKTLKMVSDLINRQQAKIEVLVEDTLCLRDTLKENESLRAEIENLNNFLYDAEGVNLVNYWYQQFEIAENGCRNFEEDNKKLQAEIERLKELIDVRHKVFETKCEELEVAKSEAIKEFARGLRQQAFDRLYVSIDEIDNLVKEMVGEDK